MPLFHYSSGSLQHFPVNRSYRHFPDSAAHISQPGMKIALADWKPAQQEVVASYWTLEPGWNTELEIKNNLAEGQLTITPPVLRTAAGCEIALPDVVLASDEVTSINSNKPSPKWLRCW